LSGVYFIGDLHFGHKRITEFVDSCGRKFRYGDSYQENMEIIIHNWNQKVSKRGKVFVLGDTAFTEEGFENLKRLNGTKVLVRGNHDNYFSTEKWLEVFDSVEGIVRYKNYWLTHAPIHPAELRGKKNIHGHVHHNIIRDSEGNPDPNYLAVCCEVIKHTPVSLDEIRNGHYADMLSNFDYIVRGKYDQ